LADEASFTRQRVAADYIEPREIRSGRLQRGEIGGGFPPREE
jgi:hypothetical protein